MDQVACAAARSERSELPPAAGLVPSKTNQEALIALDINAVTTRRIARLKKSVWSSGHLHGMPKPGFRSGVCWFVTLTYVGVDDWQRQHIAIALERYRQWCRRKGIACRYTWVAELQSRGAVHYHLLAWLPQGIAMPKWDRTPDNKRVPFWPHGMTNTQRALAGVGYLMKYLSKMGEFHRFPKGLRLYGIGGLCEQGRAVRGWLNLPEWSKRLHGVGELCRRSGGLVVRATGEILESPWRVELLPGFLRLRLTRELPARFHDGAYSTFPQVMA